MGVGDGVVHDDGEVVLAPQGGELGQVRVLEEGVGGELCAVVVLLNWGFFWLVG